MNDFQLNPVESVLFYTVDFTDEMPTAGTISSVTFSGSSALTLSSQSNDFANYKSSIKVSGAAHGGSYVLQAKAVLSNGESVVKDISLIGFNG